MYNSSEKIMDNNLTNLSYKQGVNRSFTMSEVLTGGLWHIIHGNGFYKCIPLFNCDIITSSDSRDSVLDDNQCLITIGDEDTVIKCVSDDTGGIHYHNIILYAYTPYTKLDLTDTVNVYCIVYDEYLNTLNNVLVNVVIDGSVTSQIRTSSDGIASVTVKNPCTIKFVYDETESNIVTIMED